jgi:hypothetical protein
VQVVSPEETTALQAHERAHPTRPMKPGRSERVACESSRQGTQSLIAHVAVATGHRLAPSVGPTRTAAAFVGHMARAMARPPRATWIFLVDRLNTHPSDSLVRVVARACGIDAERGITGHSGIVASMSTRADF